MRVDAKTHLTVKNEKMDYGETTPDITPKIPKMAPPESSRGFVESVVHGIADTCTRICVARKCAPETGDKFSSPQGQKFTCVPVPDEDMPISMKTGLSPDMLINPHSFPTRMTVGFLMELLAGKSAALSGRRFAAHQFEPGQTIESKMGDVFSTLKEHGFCQSGRETMYCGQTGRTFDVDIMVGTGYVFRLKHMAADKAHVRSQHLDKQDDDRNILTNQPNQGGGLRFGEMEVWATIAHGSHDLLYDLFCTGEDMVDVSINAQDGTLYPFPSETGKHIRVPQAFRVLLSELMASHIAVKIRGAAPPRTPPRKKLRIHPEGS